MYLPTMKAQNKVKSRPLLNVVVSKGPSILKLLLPSKDQPLLIWWDSFLILDFFLFLKRQILSSNTRTGRTWYANQQQIQQAPEICGTPQTTNPHKHERGHHKKPGTDKSYGPAI